MRNRFTILLILVGGLSACTNPDEGLVSEMKATLPVAAEITFR